MKIGFFDSGMGGLTVLHEALRLLPHERFVYFADSQHAPYGNKPKQQIKQYVFEAVRFMATQDLKALVVACNTATSIAIDELREQFEFPILGMEPAVKPAVNSVANKRVLVFATELTLREAKFKKLVSVVDTHRQVDYIPLQELVVMAEQFTFDESVILPYLQHKLAHLDLTQYGAMVLGCTHFPYFKKFFRQLIPADIQLIDGSVGTVNHLKNVLANNLTTQGESEVEYYISKEKADAGLFEKYLTLLDE